MRMETPDLRPSLWRTCRALANLRRLELLRILFKSPSMSVSEVARELEWPESTASKHLRLLNSRGLIQAKRTGRRVLYSPHPNPHISDSTELLEALHTAVITTGLSDEVIFQQITAFTHPRRISLVQALGDRVTALQLLSSKTGITEDACKRHLKKLEVRGIVGQCGHCHYYLRKERSYPLTDVLCTLALRSE